MKNNETICPVLIIDDDNDLCTILATILGKNYDVHIEQTLKDAEDYLTGLKPLVILLDNNLPDGLGVKHIRDILGRCPGVKIILMTADRTAGLREEALNNGAVRFLPKPFRIGAINEMIFSICPELRAA
jgi:DNA-binding NtrC family response regulator